MVAAIKQKDSSYWIKIALVLFIQIFFRFLPNLPGVTDLGMAVCGIFIGTLVGWCLCDPIWPSLSCLILLGMTAYSTTTELVSGLFGNPAVLTSLLSFLLGGCIIATGLSDWATRWLMSRSFLKGRPVVLMCMLMFAMWILTPFCSIAVLILLWEMTASIARQCGLDRDNNRWMTIMVFMLFFDSGVGFYFNWNPGVLGMVGIANAIDENFVLGAWPFTLFGIVTSLLLLIVNGIVLMLVYKPDLSALKQAKFDPPEDIPAPVKWALFIIVLLLLLTLLPAVLPKAWGFTRWLGQFGTIGALCICIAVSLIIRVKGKNLVTMKAASDKGLAWGPIFIMGTALTVAGALTSSDTGVVAALTKMLTPIFNGMSPFMFAAVMIILCVVTTNFLNNIVIAAIFIPVIFSLKDVIAFNPMAVIVTVFYACYVAVLFPSANPMVAFIYGKGDLIKKSDIFHYAPIVMGVSALVLIFIVYPFANLLY